MTYRQNTISTANPNAAFEAVIDEAFLDAGWLMVEESNYTAGDWFRVYRSPGTTNKAGYDWYTAIRWRAVGSESQFQVISGEGYDAVNKRIEAPATAANYSTSGSASNQGAMADGVTWGAVSLDAPVLTNAYNSFQSPSPSANVSAGLSVLLPSSPFAYWLQVSKDTVALALLIGSTPYVYVRSSLKYTTGLSTGPLANLNPSEHGVAILDYANTGTSGGSSSARISSTVVRPDGWDGHRPRVTTLAGRGPALPSLSASINAAAVRPTVELSVLDKVGSSGVNIDIGESIRLGEAFEGYFVYGGSIGDTVEIDAETYVIMSISPTLSNFAARMD